MDDVTWLDIPDWRHRRVWSPVRETDLAAHGVVQIAHIFIALLAKTLDRLPGVDVLKRHLIDPKVVLADHIKLNLAWAKAIIQKPLDDLRRIRILKSDRFKDEIILEPLSHIARAEMNDDTCVLSVITAYVVAKQPVKHRHKISRLAPIRRDSRLNQDFVVAVEERTVAIDKRQFAPSQVCYVTPP